MTDQRYYYIIRLCTHLIIYFSITKEKKGSKARTTEERTFSGFNIARRFAFAKLKNNKLNKYKNFNL